MNVSSVGATSTPPYAQQGGPRTPPTFSNTAKLLGLSTDQLGSDLQSGSTLASLAQQKGVSNSALMSSVEQDLQASNPLAASLPQSGLQAVASNVINGTMPAHVGGGHHHHGGGGGGGGGLLSAIDSTDDDSTSTLSGVTAPAGASIAELGLTGQSGTTTSDPTDPASILAAATDATSSPTAANNLSTLSLATGISPTDLLTQLSSGQDVSGLLGSTGVTGYGSTLAQSVSGGVAFDGYA